MIGLLTFDLLEQSHNSMSYVRVWLITIVGLYTIVICYSVTQMIFSRTTSKLFKFYIYSLFLIIRFCFQVSFLPAWSSKLLSPSVALGNCRTFGAFKVNETRELLVSLPVILHLFNHSYRKSKWAYSYVCLLYTSRCV